MKLRQRIARHRNQTLFTVGILAFLPGAVVPEPIRNCAGRLVNSAGEYVRDVWAVPADRRTDNHGSPRSCAIKVAAPIVDPANRFRVFSDFELVDVSWDGWSWYNNCAVAAAKVGRTVPIFKTDGSTNQAGQSPVLYGIIPRQPLLWHGTIEWISLRSAPSLAVWQRARAEAAARL